MSRTIAIQFKAGHTYAETWERDAALFCPHCGKQEVWVEQSGGDYYVGQHHMCLACRWTFYLPSLNECRDEYDQQRLQKLTA